MNSNLPAIIKIEDGSEIIDGTDILVSTIVEARNQGFSDSKLFELFSDLTPEALESALTYHDLQRASSS